MIITLQDYYHGNDKLYPLQLTTDLIRNAVVTVRLANDMMAILGQFGIQVEAPAVNSGWRPPAVNAATKGAAVRSKHMACQAIDVHDPDGLIDNWLMTPQGQDALAKVGLWMEHPSATKGWSHWQTVPPASGNRVFYP